MKSPELYATDNGGVVLTKEFGDWCRAVTQALSSGDSNSNNKPEGRISDSVILDATHYSNLSQKIQMMAWGYMAKDKLDRDGVKLADEIIRLVGTELTSKPSGNGEVINKSEDDYLTPEPPTDVHKTVNNVDIQSEMSTVSLDNQIKSIIEPIFDYYKKPGPNSTIKAIRNLVDQECNKAYEKGWKDAMQQSNPPISPLENQVLKDMARGELKPKGEE